VCGTIFKLTKDRKESVLYAFKGGSDGSGPFGTLMMDSAGNIYGTTLDGGSGAGCDNGSNGCGTVFKLAPDGTETALYAFQGGADGYFPESNVVMDSNGNLFGSTGGGGIFNANCGDGCGTIFEVQANGTKTALYQFQGGSDGAGPFGPLIADSAGNLYGTTGGGGGCDCGTVFEITPSGHETILYVFQGGADGFEPLGGVISDGTGNFYGTTISGGARAHGVVFKVPAGGGSESVLYNFASSSDGADPRAGVIMDASGNLYGTTWAGGGRGCEEWNGCGTVFKLAPDGTETVLARLKGKHGEAPVAPLLLGKQGELLGTTSAGGTDKDGVIFEVKK
jgi:uncharacterized repeat protein (TIGR03803 family)